MITFINYYEEILDSVALARFAPLCSTATCGEQPSVILESVFANTHDCSSSSSSKS